MTRDFFHTTYGSTVVSRLGLSASYRPGKADIHKAIDEGINFFFFYGFDGQMTSVLRDVMKRDREKYAVCTGAYNLYWGHPNIRRSLEKRLRQLGTDYLDAFPFLGTTGKREFTGRVRDELVGLRDEGKIGGMGLSGHDRKFIGGLAGKGDLDVAMVRNNAAHRGAENDVFPYLHNHRPFVVGYTATRWRYLMRRPPIARRAVLPPLKPSAETLQPNRAQVLFEPSR